MAVSRPATAEPATEVLRVAAGETVALQCPEQALARVPSGPTRLLRAGGTLQVIESTETDLLVQGAPGHRGWVPQTCADQPLDVVPLLPVTETEPPRRGPSIALHWTPDCPQCDALLDGARALTASRPDLRIDLVAHGEPAAVLAGVPHPAPFPLWFDEKNVLGVAGDAPRVVFRAPDGTTRRLDDDGETWPTDAIEAAVPRPPPERFSLDMMADTEHTANAALRQPYLTPQCESAAVQHASAQDPLAGRYVQWMAQLVHDRKLHDIALWDFTTIGRAKVAADPTIQCILDTMAPFVAIRGGPQPTFASTQIHPDTDFDTGLVQLQQFALERGLRFILIHIDEPSLTEAQVGGNATVPIRSLHLSPSAAARPALARAVGLPTTGGSVLVAY